MLDVLFVLQHDLIQQISIELDCLNHFDRPWFGVGFQIFDSELETSSDWGLFSEWCDSEFLSNGPSIESNWVAAVFAHHEPNRFGFPNMA